MKFNFSETFNRSCRRCGFDVQWVDREECRNGSFRNTLTCIICGANNQYVSNEYLGIKERTSESVHKAIPEKIRSEVRVRAGCRCELCGKDSSKAELHISHIVSVMHGIQFGIPNRVLNSAENLMLMCSECNTDFGSETIPLRIAVIILAVRSRSSIGSEVDSIINKAMEGQ